MVPQSVTSSALRRSRRQPPGQPERAPLIRVDAIAEVDGVVRVLDLLDPTVRAAVTSFDGSDLSGLDSSAVGRDFV